MKNRGEYPGFSYFLYPPLLANDGIYITFGLKPQISCKMIPKWLYYLLNVTAYPLAIYLAIWLSNNVRYDPQGMAGGYQMLYYAMVAVVICFIVSLFASYKLVGSCWPAVIVLIGFIVMLFLWYSIMTS